MISRGAMRDLQVVMFASSMFKTSKSYDGSEEDLISTNRADQKFKNQNRKKIAKFDKMAADLDKLCESIFENISPEDGDRARPYLKSRNKKNTIKALQAIDDGAIQLDVLGAYILYANFCDNRKQKLDQMFDPLTDAERYFELADLSTELLINRDKESELHDWAIKAIGILKA